MRTFGFDSMGEQDQHPALLTGGFRSNLEYGQNFYSQRVPRRCNQLPDHVKNARNTNNFQFLVYRRYTNQGIVVLEDDYSLRARDEQKELQLLRKSSPWAPAGSSRITGTSSTPKQVISSELRPKKPRNKTYKFLFQT